MGRILRLTLAAVVLLVILISVLFTATVLVRTLRYRQFFVSADREAPPPRLLMTKMYDTLKTGDIVLFTPQLHNFLNSLVQPNRYSHAGMVVEGPGDRRWIAESRSSLGSVLGAPDSLPSDEPDGTVLSPLLSRIKAYPGFVYVMPLSRALDPQRAGRVAAAARQQCPYPKLGYGLLRFFRLSEGSTQAILRLGQPSRHCFEWVAHLLDAAGLAPVSLREKGWLEVCAAIAQLTGEPLRGGYAYLPPYQILYDVGAGAPQTQPEPNQ